MAETMAINGYYDGASVQLLGRITIKKNQRVLVTPVDDFITADNEPLPRVSEKARAFEELEALRKECRKYWS